MCKGKKRKGDGLNERHQHKGGLISKSFTLWLKSPYSLDPPKVKMLRTPFFGHLSQNKKLSEIKPPLVRLVKLSIRVLLIKSCVGLFL